MRNTGWLRVGAAALALAVAGCGSSDDGNSAAAPGGEAAATPVAAAADVDPCSLITKEEVAAITTDAVTRTVRMENICKYRGDQGDDGVDVTLFLNDAERQMNAMRKSTELLNGMAGEVADKGAAGADAAAMMKKSGAPVPNVGDEAAWGMNTTLGVRKGRHYFDVTPPFMHEMGKRPGLPMISAEEKRSIAERVATTVAGRLPG